VEKFDWLAGMFLVVNSISFRKLQGFDTDFFMYVEDCDLSMRARKAGMKIGDLEGFSVVHDARRASTKSFKHLRWHITSLLRYWFLK
jgi:GT2 family glycosyltransferase